MKKEKAWIASMRLKNGKMLKDASPGKKPVLRDAVKGAVSLCGGETAGLFLWDETDADDDVAREKTLDAIRAVCRAVDVPVAAGGNVTRFEDVKKLCYAGCRRVVLFHGALPVRTEAALKKEVSARFGKETLVTVTSSVDVLRALAKDFSPKKLTPAISFTELKKNELGLVPVVVQDFRTDEVLMVAYMNAEAYRKTCETGRMHYFSRERKKLWMKGEESGHFQYVRELRADCDLDTILARVRQIGAACHTGHRSCFFNGVAKWEDLDTGNPKQVLEEVYDVIAERKRHPKEGSYTNYLFDKGIDKILKKLGEESTEIVIAAKNPNDNELHYEIADYLYHLMVLMNERGVTWEEITDELARRQHE